MTNAERIAMYTTLHLLARSQQHNFQLYRAAMINFLQKQLDRDFDNLKVKL